VRKRNPATWFIARRRRIDFGIVLALIGLVIAVLAVNPHDWRHNLASWTSDAVSHWVLILVCVASFFLGIVVSHTVIRSSSTASEAEVIGPETFEDRFNRSITHNAVRVVKVFGYTQETMSDYLRFDHRKRPIEMRVLNRNWLREQEDERNYNAINSGRGLRGWHKALAIQRNAKRQPPPGALRRLVRYYDGPPSIKAILLCGDTVLEGFISFYEWQDPPPDGGSPFKGADRSMIHLRSEIREAADILRYLESQFEFAWQSASSPETLGLRPS